MLTLRAATSADAELLARLMADTFPQKFGPILGDKTEMVLQRWLRLSQRQLKTTTIAEIEGNGVGFLVVSPTEFINGADEDWFWQALRAYYNPLQAAWRLRLLALFDSDYRTHRHELYIELIGTVEAWRGQGVGRQLIAHAERLAQQRNLDRISLSVLSDNEMALRFYEQQGFQRLALRPNRWLSWFRGQAGYYQMVKRLA